jgi:hypothetical protein
MERKFNNLEPVELKAQVYELAATEIITFVMSGNIVTVILKMKPYVNHGNLNQEDTLYLGKNP